MLFLLGLSLLSLDAQPEISIDVRMAVRVVIRVLDCVPLGVVYACVRRRAAQMVSAEALEQQPLSACEPFGIVAATA